MNILSASSRIPHLIIALAVAFGLAGRIGDARAQTFPITISFEKSEWKPASAGTSSGGSYNTAQRSIGIDPPIFRVSKIDSKDDYTLGDTTFTDNWLHFSAVEFSADDAVTLKLISIPIRFTREIVSPVTWKISLSSPIDVSEGADFEEKIRKIAKNLEAKSATNTLSAHFARYVEARYLWQTMQKKSGYEGYKWVAMRHALEAAAGIQSKSNNGIYFDEEFIDQSIEYFDQMPAQEKYRPVLKARIADVIFASWTQMGNAVPTINQTAAEREKYCKINYAYDLLGRSWLQSAIVSRKRYWEFVPSYLNITLDVLAKRQEPCSLKLAPTPS